MTTPAIVSDLATGTALHTLAGHRDTVRAVAVTSDGTGAVTASSDRTAIVWDLATGTALHTLAGHQDRVETVAITGDDTRAVTTSDDHTALVWYLASGARLRSLTGHQGPIQAVAATSDGSWAVTASDDWTAAVWNLSTGAPTAIWHGDDGMLRAACSPKGPIFVIGDYRGGVYSPPTRADIKATVIPLKVRQHFASEPFHLSLRTEHADLSSRPLTDIKPKIRAD